MRYKGGEIHSNTRHTFLLVGFEQFSEIEINHIRTNKSSLWIRI